jgi:peptidoglycan/xylan/chitin deacetylase (PgdA/CDA1 family)
MNAMTFSLSVDDGHPLDLRIADMLQRHGLRATFYVPIHNSEGAPVMTSSQAHELARHFDVGSHTLDHRYLTTLNDAAAWRQITEGKTELEQRIGRQVSGFCYPGGKYLARHQHMVSRAGFRYARTTRNLYPCAGHQPWVVPTSLQFYPHGRSVLIRNFFSQGSYTTRWPAFRAIVMEENWLMRLYRLFDHLEQHGSVFHLWCHAADVEHLQLWKALDHFLGFVARRIPVGRRLDNAGLIDSQLRNVALMLPDHQKIM